MTKGELKQRWKDYEGHRVRKETNRGARSRVRYRINELEVDIAAIRAIRRRVKKPSARQALDEEISQKRAELDAEKTKMSELTSEWKRLQRNNVKKPKRSV